MLRLKKKLAVFAVSHSNRMIDELNKNIFWQQLDLLWFPNHSLPRGVGGTAGGPCVHLSPGHTVAKQKHKGHNGLATDHCQRFADYYARAFFHQEDHGNKYFLFPKETRCGGPTSLALRRWTDRLPTPWMSSNLAEVWFQERKKRQASWLAGGLGGNQKFPAHRFWVQNTSLKGWSFNRIRKQPHAVGSGRLVGRRKPACAPHPSQVKHCIYITLYIFW